MASPVFKSVCDDAVLLAAREEAVERILREEVRMRVLESIMVLTCGELVRICG